MIRKPFLYALAATLCVTFAFVFWQSTLSSQQDGFIPPDAAARKKAVGDTIDLELNLRVAFDSSDQAFAPIPALGPSSWLTSQRESGQTFEDYRISVPNRPDQMRSTIYIVPLGNFPEELAPDLDEVSEFASAYFEMPVKRLAGQRIEDVPFRSRSRAHGTQILTGDVLKWLRTQVPDDAYCLLAVTMTDLYNDPSWNFVFGQASLRDRVGVYSFARYLPRTSDIGISEEDWRLLMLRSCKVLAHETGHMFGIKHCVHYHCLMNGSNGLDETDAAPVHFCPVCLRKLHFAKPFDIQGRYENLQLLSERFGWDEEANWYAGRLQVLNRQQD